MRPEYAYTTPPPRPAPPPPPRAASHHYTTTPVDLKKETAIVSVDPATASIVVRAPLTQRVLDKLRVVDDQMFVSDHGDFVRINPKYAKALDALLRETYGSVQSFAVPKAIPSTKFDKLMQVLTVEDKARIYRMLAAKYHPDVQHTGTNAVMSLINEVFKGR